MNCQDEYKSKIVTADKAAELIPASGNISMGMAASEPPAILKALEKRVLSGSIRELKFYYMHSEKPMHDSILKYEYMDKIKPYPFYVGAIERELVQQGLKENKKVIYYMPGNFSSVPGILKEIGIDVFLLTVSPMDKAGYFSCGTNADYTIPTARNAKKVIIEVNSQMPRVFGDCCLHISDVDAVVENACPLVEIPSRPSADMDKKIGKYIIEMVPDRATIQFGVGGVPNAVCEMLVNHKDLGVHSELMAPGLAKLIQSGAVTNKYKKINRYKNVYTLAMGDKDMYEFLNNNSSMEAYPVYYVNNPYVIGQNDNVISVNAFIEVDLSGQVNAEFLMGRQFSAPGGQLDFVRGAQISPGGKSILTAYSTAAHGKVSRIVAKLSGPATDPRADTQYVVTEYGVVNLQGKSTTERAMALIQIAHPDFRDQLFQQAKEMGHV
ncbi:MAG: 4-hydroxybutyrate CoA-transferase [Gammaproteobacteria bacterium RIFCSPHIGHO2_12_FULL_41_20]|nr:MAG: 4-hydroxybutyrate CoA-transferase [Gammaproteobacteria bacterium RIFCSPHIGHO2_12_FULL_41_20]